ncbi:hypothetical protein BGZ76_003792 [Entomortierella beljakovae]|nr:hypothetical protein BGZ76_003792 [Entomortierella beljakovae]
MNPASHYAYIPYTPNSQVTSPGLQTQQSLSPQQQQQQHLVAQELAGDLSSPSTPLSLHPSLQSPTTNVSNSSPSSITVRSTGSALGNHGHPTINTAMIQTYGGMLPSPQQSSQVPTTPTATTTLPTTPPQTTDLDTILANYSHQPELLKIILSSKTEEDRRWAEEARFKMMDLIIRGENRGLALITGYESLLSQVVPGNGNSTSTATTATITSAVGTPVSNASTGNISASTSPSVSSANTATVTTMAASSNLALVPTGKCFVEDEYDTYSGTGSSRDNSNNDGSIGYGQGSDQALSRKRSVTFARDINHGHLRSQSMSSVPTMSNVVSSTNTSNDNYGGLMLGLTGSNIALQQPQQQHQQQQQQHQYHSHQPLHPIQQSALHQLPPLNLPQPYQHQPSQFQQQASHQVSHQQLPPHFGQYSQVYQYHVMPQLHPPGGIRRTNSLSHIPHLAQNQHTTVTEPRLVAGRPRNDSASSLRNFDDDSDEESDDDDYSNHPVMNGLSSRPGSSLSMNNMVGGNGETSLTLDSGPTVYSQGQVNSPTQSQSHQNQGLPNTSVGSASILSSIHGPGSLGSMSMPSVGSNGIRATATTGASATTVTTTTTTTTTMSAAAAAAAAAAALDPKRKRKRREMQPVNKIVESMEPIIDPFLWKNNGNTTQKKTGCKSVYYKCSNSPGGCTVNKTVTEKEGGGYITKYRGEHLEDCIKLRRAQLAAQSQVAHLPYTLQREQ